MDAVTNALTSAGSIITAAFEVIQNNPWLLILVAAPVLLGILGAIIAFFKH